MKTCFLVCLGAFTSTLTIHAQDYVQLPNIEVKGRGTVLVGEAISASQGIIGHVDLETRPMLRTGEILEAIPGLIVTQHSGSGKANQYFLRGFNLDHGTDFATWIDGMPVNMVSHGHGQGYTDLNFIIPELTTSITYLKGSYYSSVGDFSSAGSAIISTTDRLDGGLAKVTFGEDNYLRLVAASSQEVADGEILLGLERATNDGPWDLHEDLDKINGLLKFTKPFDHGQYSLSFMGYDSSWNSSDQIPERAVEQGLITALGSIDPTVGGESSRYSISANVELDNGDARTSASVYAVYYDMNIWSNFTYFLDDPTHGDQFQQADRRMIYGAAISRTFTNQNLFERSIRHTIGLQTRFDDIDAVGLYRTRARRRLSTSREDAVQELSFAAFYDASISWSELLKTNLGVRLDSFEFEVDSNLPANSGKAHDSLISPKFNAILTPTEHQEYYFSAGYGFHSNDARGSTITVDPTDPDTDVEKVDPLVSSFGYEIGLRHNWNEWSNSSVALWSLELDSELLYVGDAGNTEASRPSERYGLEVTNYIRFSAGLSLDADIAFTDTKYADSDPAGRAIPGSIDSVASGGISYRSPNQPWFASLRYRYFSGRPLIEDDSVRSDSFGAFNFKLGYKSNKWQASLDVLNLFNSKDHDITYFYSSRLPGEPEEGVSDRHFHIIEPRSFRLNVTRRF